MHVADTSTRSPARDGRPNATVIACTVVAALGGLLFGFDTAVISGVTRDLTTEYGLTPSTLGFTVAIALWGTIAGAAGAGYAGDRYGRRDSLRALAVLFVVSALGCAFAWDWMAFVVSRLIAGVAIGAASVLGPMYIAEIAPARWRGRMVAAFQLNIVFGILVAYFSNYVIGTVGLGADEWRWKMGISAAPAALFFVALLGIPRSPRWLMKQGRVDEARAVLDRVAGRHAEAEYDDIRQALAVDREAGDTPLFSRRYRYPVLLAVTIALFNQLSGINPVLYYLNDIFAKAGFDKVSGDLQAVAIGVTNLAFTALAMTVIDRIGRKTLLLIGAVGTCLCMAVIAALFQTTTYQHLLLWPLIGFIAFFALSQGAVIWVYIAEIFPNAVRGKGQSLGSFTHWVACAVLSNLFPLVASWSAAGPFVFFTGMMALQFVVVARFFPETKGFTLEELQRKLEARPPAA